jgi:hypothetical protein
MLPRVNQSVAQADGDIVAVNKEAHYHLPATTPMSRIERRASRWKP